MNAESDTNLLQRWLSQRDPHAFREIATRHSCMVFATCRRILRDAAEAEDVTQECFLTLAQHTEHPPESLPAWLHVMAVRRSLNHLRSLGRRTAREKEFLKTTAAMPEPNLHQVLGEVDEALAELPESLRALLVLHFLEQRNQEEIAAQLGVSQSTISRRIDQGIAELRTRLERRGVAVTATALLAGWKAEAAAQVSPALSAALGKISLSGTGGSVAAGAVGPGLMILGGILVKKAVAGVLALAIVLVTAVVWQSQKATVPKGPETTLNPVANEEEDQTAAAPVAAAAPAPSALVEAPETVTDAAPRGAIAGRVLDAVTGAGVAGVEVTLEWGALQGPRNKPSHEETTRSAEDGTYSFAGLAAENTTYTLIPEPPPGYRRPTYLEKISVNLAASGVAEQVDILLRPEAPLRGIVVNERNQPVAGAKVLLGGGTDFYVGQTVESVADGTFDFHGLPPTQDLHIVATVGELQASAPYSFSLPEEGLTDLVLTLQAACQISGTVVDAEGTPMEGIFVRTLDVPKSRIGTGTSEETDPAGRFHITGLAVGSYELVPAPSQEAGMGTDQKGTLVELAPGQSLEGVVLVYARGLGISGQVTSVAGEPIAGAEVRAGSPWHGGGSATSDENGDFSIPELEEGEYQVDTQAKGYQYASYGGVPAGTVDLKVVLPEPFHITGQVVDAATGQPLPNFEVVLSVNWEEELGSWEEKQFEKVSHPEGRFELHQPQLYRSVLAARAPGYATAMKFLDLTGPPYAHEVELRLEAGPDLQGRVVDEQGKPIAGAGVYWGNVVAMGDRSSAQTGADGTFTLRSFPTQSQLVSAYHPGYAPGARLITGSARLRPVDIVLSAGGSIQGTVSFAPEMEAAVCQASVAHSEGHYVPEGQTEVAADGTFMLERVTPGEVEVSVVVGSDLPWQQRTRLTRTVTVEAGAVTNVHFEVRPASSGLEGVLNFPPNTVVSRANLLLRVATEVGISTHSTFAGSGGHFNFSNLPAGDATLELDIMFQNHPRIFTTVEVTVPEESVGYVEVPL